MISETFKKQPTWRKWGTVIFISLSIVFIIVSYATPQGIISPDEWTEFNPFLSLVVLLLIFGSILGSKLAAWGVIIGVVYSFIADVLLSDCYGYGDCGLPWFFPPYKTMWLIVPSLFFANIGFIIERLVKSAEKI